MDKNNYDNIYQKGFKDGYEMAMKLLINNKIMPNDQINNTIMNSIGKDKSLVQNNTDLFKDNYLVQSDTYDNNIKPDNNYHNTFNNEKKQKKNKKVINIIKNNNNNNNFEEFVEHFTLQLQYNKTIDDIISLISKYINKIYEKKLLILLNENLENYIFLNKDYSITNLKYISKIIYNKIKLLYNIDIYIYININSNTKNHHIVVDKFKKMSNKMDKVILIQ
jgi:hypothetical protein